MAQSVIPGSSVRRYEHPFVHYASQQKSTHHSAGFIRWHDKEYRLGRFLAAEAYKHAGRGAAGVRHLESLREKEVYRDIMNEWNREGFDSFYRAAKEMENYNQHSYPPPEVKG